MVDAINLHQALTKG
jgi:hypothetical protein